MKGVADESVQNTALENILQQVRVSAQLLHTAVAGDGDCLFHSYTANILYTLFKESPERDSLEAITTNLLPYIRTETLNIALPQRENIKAVFTTLKESYSDNFAALSQHIMVPALRNMLYARRNDPAVKAIAMPLLRDAIDGSEHNDFEPGFQDVLHQESSSLSEDALYARYWDCHQAMGIYASPIEQAVMDHLLGVKSHLVQTHNLALGTSVIENGKANVYLRKTAAHFDAYLGVHPKHGAISEEDKALAEALSLGFTRTHISQVNDNRQFFYSEPARLMPKAKPVVQTAEAVVTAFFKRLPDQDLKAEERTQIIQAIRQGNQFPQLAQAKQDVDAFIAKHKIEITVALKERLETLGNEKRALTFVEKEELEKGDEKIARVEQLEEIKIYLEHSQGRSPRR